MNINKQKISAMVTVGAILVLPFIVMATSGEHVGIPCTGLDCDFDDLIVLASNIMNFLIYYIAVPLAALGFMWAGADLVLNQDKAHSWSEAKERFWDIGKGFAIMISAFLLIKFVLFQFLSDEQAKFMNFIIG